MSRFPTITNEYLQSRERFELSEEEKKSPLAEIFNRPMPKIDQRRLDILNGGMANPQLALKIENRSDMFLPADQSMEEGYCVMEDGFRIQLQTDNSSQMQPRRCLIGGSAGIRLRQSVWLCVPYGTYGMYL